jgi:hypothetical protein
MRGLEHAHGGFSTIRVAGKANRLDTNKQKVKMFGKASRESIRTRGALR